MIPELIVAIDTRDEKRIADTLECLNGYIDHFLFGMEPLWACIELPKHQIIDAKLKGIPRAVAGSVHSICHRYHPHAITIHADGGGEMIQAARIATEECSIIPRPKILTTTVMTHLVRADLFELGTFTALNLQVLRLCYLAQKYGADGIVCSGLEAAEVRKHFGASLEIFVTAVRPASDPALDQKRTTTPFQAAQSGADYVIVGDPITSSLDPLAKARQIKAEMASAFPAADPPAEAKPPPAALPGQPQG